MTRYLGLFGDHIIRAILYRYPQVLLRTDLLSSNGKPGSESRSLRVASTDAYRAHAQCRPRTRRLLPSAAAPLAPAGGIPAGPGPGLDSVPAVGSGPGPGPGPGRATPQAAHWY